MNELLRTGIHRANFQTWEIEILLDIESCPLRGPASSRASVRNRFPSGCMSMLFRNRVAAAYPAQRNLPSSRFYNQIFSTGRSG